MLCRVIISKVYGIHCSSNAGSNSRRFYEEISESSGGCFLTNIHFNLITEMFLAGNFLNIYILQF